MRGGGLFAACRSAAPHPPRPHTTPRCKLAVLGGDGGGSKRPSSSRNVYKANKRQAVADCRTVLAANQFDRRWTQFFERLPKKDDAADCLLQALAVAVT